MQSLKSTWNKTLFCFVPWVWESRLKVNPFLAHKESEKLHSGQSPQYSNYYYYYYDVEIRNSQRLTPSTHSIPIQWRKKSLNTHLFTTWTTSSSCNTWSLPTFCGLNLTDEPQTNALYRKITIQCTKIILFRFSLGLLYFALVWFHLGT